MSAEMLIGVLQDIRRLQDLNRSRLHIEVVKYPPYAFVVTMSVDGKTWYECFHRGMDDDRLQARYKRIERLYKQYE